MEIYAHLHKRHVLPLALDVFSIEDPTVGSQILQIYRTVDAVNKAIDCRGVWISHITKSVENLQTLWGVPAINKVPMWISFVV